MVSQFPTKILKHLTLKTNHQNWGVRTACIWNNRKCPWLTSPAQKMSCLFLSLPAHLSNIMVSSTQTLAQIKSQEFADHIKQHFMTCPVTYVANGIQDVVKCCIESWMHLNLWHNNMLLCRLQGRKERFYLTMHSTHFIYGYMASNIWLRTILIVMREETCCHHMGYSFRLTARVLLYAPSHGLCYISRGALAGKRNSSMGPPHEGSFRQSIAPLANALNMELHGAHVDYKL